MTGTETERVRIGVVGLGSVSQQMHLPYLAELEEAFEVVGVCDASRQLSDEHGGRLRVPAFTDHRRLLEQRPDALLVAVSGPSEQIVVDALAAGCHVLAEKPLAWSPSQAERIAAAQSRSARTLLVGYMKRYDPGVLLAGDLLAQCGEIRGGTVRCVAGPNDLYITDVARVRRADDVPPAVSVAREQAIAGCVAEVLGRDDPALRLAYLLVLGITCHELSVLDELVGQPEKIVASTVWEDGRWLAATLGYPGMCLNYLLGRQTGRSFDEIFELYGDSGLLRISFPSPFLKNAPTIVMRRRDRDSTGVTSEETFVASYREAFRSELEHFHDCVVGAATPRSGIDDALAHAKVMAALLQSARDGEPKVVAGIGSAAAGPPRPS